MSLGQRIEERRQELGISQAELARRVGVRQSTMNSLINGESRTSRSLLKIARELQTTPAYLIGESNDPKSDAVMSRPISSSARELLDCFEQLPDEEQRAVLHIVRRMAGHL